MSILVWLLERVQEFDEHTVSGSVAEKEMIKTIEAIFDGTVFRPTEKVDLEPETHVRIMIEAIELAKDQHPSFLRMARSLRLEGPPDWSSNLETYLHGGERNHDA